MLEGLDRVEWATLWACGWATEIPQLLRALASPDQAVREEVLEELPHLLVYQGASILEATSYAVPFLLELLAAPVVEEKADLLCLLAAIARGQPFLLGAGALDRYEDEASAPPDLQAELAKQREWVQRSAEAVEQGVPLYLPFLAHPEVEVRLFAADLLALFPAQAAVSIPPLQAVLAQEADELVQAQVVVSLGTLLGPEAAALQFLRTYVQADPPSLLGFVAALAYARRAQTTTPPEVVHLLVESVAEAETLAEPYQQFPEVILGDYYSFLTQVCKTLALVDPTLAVPALITILHGLHDGGGALDVQERFIAVECLLAAAFAQPAPPSPSLMPFVLAQQPRIEVFHRQVRKARSQEGVEVEATLEAVNTLLGAAFTQERPLSAAPLVRPGAPALTAVQRAALTALVDADAFWSGDGTSDLQESNWRMDQHTLFTRYGLPASRDTLRHLLAGPGASPAGALAPTLTQTQYWVVNMLVVFGVLWESAPDLLLRLEQLLVDSGLPSSRAALRDLLLG